MSRCQFENVSGTRVCKREATVGDLCRSCAKLVQKLREHFASHCVWCEMFGYPQDGHLFDDCPQRLANHAADYLDLLAGKREYMNNGAFGDWTWA